MASRARSRRRFKSSTSRLTVKRYAIRECAPRYSAWGWSFLLGVGLVLSLRAVADRPDVAIGVRESPAVPAPLQLRRGLEDLSAGLRGLVHDLVDALFATDDVVKDETAESAAVSTHADTLCQTVATIEADERTAVWDEEDGDAPVVLDLPPKALGLEALG